MLEMPKSPPPSINPSPPAVLPTTEAQFPNPNKSPWAGIRTYNDPNELWARAQEYFAGCQAHNEPYLIVGLALYLGFSSRKNFLGYEEQPGFEDVIAACRAVVEQGYERRLGESKPTGAIFALKNMGWRDEKHVDMTSSDGSMTPKTLVVLDTSKLSTDILAAVYDALTVKTIEHETNPR